MFYMVINQKGYCKVPSCLKNRYRMPCAHIRIAILSLLYPWSSFQEPLPRQPISGMYNKTAGKVRLTFKLEVDQLWIGTKGKVMEYKKVVVSLILLYRFKLMFFTTCVSLTKDRLCSKC